jgi:hypothetical protein
MGPSSWNSSVRHSIVDAFTARLSNDWRNFLSDNLLQA